MSLHEIFERLGGPAEIGRAIGKTTEHAAGMKRRQSVPVRYWPKLLELAARRGVCLTEAMLTAAHIRTAA